MIEIRKDPKINTEESLSNILLGLFIGTITGLFLFVMILSSQKDNIIAILLFILCVGTIFIIQLLLSYKMVFDELINITRKYKWMKKSITRQIFIIEKEEWLWEGHSRYQSDDYIILFRIEDTKIINEDKIYKAYVTKNIYNRYKINQKVRIYQSNIDPNEILLDGE